MRKGGMAPDRLLVVLSSVPDPRVARTRRYPIGAILTIALLAVINGAAGWEDMEEFADVRRIWLSGFLDLPDGLPSADTFRRVFEAIDVRALGACLFRLISEVAPDLSGQVVAIDGKTMRRSFDRRTGKSPLHMVSAWVAEHGITLGQVATDEKSNEITAIPELLSTIDVRGATVTIDAMGCQKKIASAIVDAGADYALALKDNHPTLRAEVERAFEDMAEGRTKTPRANRHEVTSKGHGREETRRVTVCSNVSGLTDCAEWTNLRSIAMVERTRTVGNKTSVEKAYYLSSLIVNAKTMERRVRAHWSIENALHWTLDVVFGEDSSRIRSRGGAENLSAVRKLALSLLKLEQSRPGKSIAMKRKRAGWEPDYAFRVLSMISAFSA
jgi:predicted transposase YbfD/YdcC